MKSLIVLCSVGLVALVIPACAQQDKTSSSGQSAPAAQTASDRQPLPAPTSNDFWDGDDPNFGNLITHPFASKTYVRRHTEPIRDRLNELDQLTSENGKMIKDEDARAKQGIQLASEKAGLADQHATDAQSKAQMAQTTATEASTRVSAAELAVQNLDQYKGAATTEIRFRSGQSVLSKDAKDALDQMAATLKDQRSYIIEVRGFSTGRSQTAMATSQRMADSVVRYLVLNHQIPVYRISAMSMGNAPGQGVGNLARHGNGGRVEVSVLHNDSISTAKR
jgi:outer membrane protein OmpA-like peptidoglycan-associated protein